MSDTPSTSQAKSMDAIMSLCKRRGFIYQASEIYGGINGFWDYGPLGAQMKKNLRDAWWQDMIMRPCWGKDGPNGKPVRCVPVETRIIQHPKVWEASGHVGGFNDPMVDCRETKQRYRYDHVSVFVPASSDPGDKPLFAYMKDSPSEAKQQKKAEKAFGQVKTVMLTTIPVAQFAKVLGPDAEKVGTLTEPKQFNLMFKTYIGATASEDDKAYMRPETAQGVFVQFKNVVDTTRVKVPFGIGNTGTSFRNEVTPRNFTFRSREFEQAELEFFCHPDESVEWYKFWRDFRMQWWQSIGLTSENLILREHEKDELSHYSSGTSDVEYRFPFTAPGYGELEGIAHRGCFDLTQHQQHSGVKMEYNDTERGEILPNGGRRGERYIPHCIEPAAGLDRGVLALICEAYTRDDSRPSPEFMKFHPRIAPIKAAIFPLVAKDGMPEIAEKLHADLTNRFWKLGPIEMDEKQSIGKRYARMDEAGCPYCFTIDGDTLKDQTVTCRDRDSGSQTRISIDKVGDFLAEKLGV
ncbi:MAG: glycine--tRNA ligase [Phycisphaeraceae bacterium]|nr:glycine--tRNA ligase [Phycisphaeraceae bacterium]